MSAPSSPPQAAPRSTPTSWLAQPRIRLLIAILVTLIVAITLYMIQTWRESVPLGPQRSVESINPKMGIHTRLTDEVEAWKIKRTLEMVREMGATWTVEYFPWAYVENQPGRFGWNHSDLVIDHAERQGLKVIARLGFVPEWARPIDTSPLYLDEDRFVDFGRYAAEFARRYAGRVDYIIIWNEPNLALEWGYDAVDPAKYVKMLRVVYPMVKEANPDVKVLAGALAPTLAAPGSPDGMNDLDYLQAMYDLGAAEYFDILAIHAYGWYSDPDEAADPTVVNFRRSELLRGVMVANGDEDKSAMITEGGWNDHPRWTRAVRPGQRIAYTIRAYQVAQEEWPWMEAVALWAFRFPWDAKSYQDYFTFVLTDFEPKPIYEEVQRYSQGELTAQEEAATEGEP